MIAFDVPATAGELDELRWVLAEQHSCSTLYVGACRACAQARTARAPRLAPSTTMATNSPASGPARRGSGSLVAVGTTAVRVTGVRHRDCCPMGDPWAPNAGTEMSAWVRTDDGWRHRPWFKVAINAILRAVQTSRRPARLFVLATVCEDGDPPRILGYRFRRVLHR